MAIGKEVINKIKRFIPLKIGTNLYVNEIAEVSGTNKIVVSIGISVPRIIYDDSLQKQYIKFIRFDNLYKIEFDINEKSEISTIINLAVIYDKFAQRESRLIFNIENIILDEIYPKLIEISLIKNNLRMIYVILAGVVANKIFTQREIDRFPKRERLKKYISFLEQYGIIRKNKEGDYVAGNIPIELHNALKNKDENEVLRYTFGYVLKDGRKYLKDELNLHMLDTFISIATTYYYLSARVGKLIELNTSYILNKKGSMYLGDNLILDKIKSLFS